MVIDTFQMASIKKDLKDKVNPFFTTLSEFVIRFSCSFFYKLVKPHRLIEKRKKMRNKEEAGWFGGRTKPEVLFQPVESNCLSYRIDTLNIFMRIHLTFLI